MREGGAEEEALEPARREDGARGCGRCALGEEAGSRRARCGLCGSVDCGLAMAGADAMRGRWVTARFARIGLHLLEFESSPSNSAIVGVSGQAY